MLLVAARRERSRGRLCDRAIEESGRFEASPATPGRRARKSRRRAQRVLVPAGRASPVRRPRCIPPGAGNCTRGRITGASVGPLGLAARQRVASGALAGAGAACVSEPRQTAGEAREAAASSTAHRGARFAARARSSTRCASTSRVTTRGRSTGGRQRGASTVVVRTWRPERDRRLRARRSTPAAHRPARVGDGTRLDVAIDAALLLAALAAKAGDRVSVMSARRPGARPVGRGGVRRDALPALLRSMAGLHPRLVETDARAMAAAVLGRVRQRALVVVLHVPRRGGDSTRDCCPCCLRCTARHLVVVASVADPVVASMAAGIGDAGEVYNAAAAAETHRGDAPGVDAAAAAWRRGGVRASSRVRRRGGRRVFGPEGRRPALTRPRSRRPRSRASALPPSALPPSALPPSALPRRVKGPGCEFGTICDPNPSLGAREGTPLTWSAAQVARWEP